MTRPDLSRHREPLTVLFSARTDTGRVRDANEDHFLVDRKLRLFVVCDGLGGHASGEVASSLAVNAVHEAIVRRSDLLEAFEFDTGAVGERDILDLLTQAVTHANTTVVDHAAGNGSLRGMATTLSLLLVARDRAFIAHVGDTRVYRLRDGALRQLSEDHSLAAELQRGLELPPALAARLDGPHGSPITRAIGADARVSVDVAAFDALAGDRYLLASDGLHGLLDAAQIGALLVLDDVGAIADRLVDAANLAGGRDNITAIALALDDSPSSTSPRRIWPEFDAIRAAPGLRALADEVVASIVERSQALDLAPRDLLLTEERTTSIPGLFIVADGEMLVSQGGLLQSQLRVGDTFGEESLLIERTSTASYTAGDNGARLLLFERVAFDELTQTLPEVALPLTLAVSRILARRLDTHARELGARPGYRNGTAPSRPVPRPISNPRLLVDTQPELGQHTRLRDAAVAATEVSLDPLVGSPALDPTAETVAEPAELDEPGVAPWTPSAIPATGAMVRRRPRTMVRRVYPAETQPAPATPSIPRETSTAPQRPPVTRSLRSPRSAELPVRALTERDTNPELRPPPLAREHAALEHAESIAQPPQPAEEPDA